MSLRTQKRRRKEKKTDYKLRIGLLKSGKPRIAIRKTNRYMIVQLIESNEAKDKIIAGTDSRELLKHGWDKKFAGSLKSIPASYLTGLIMAKKIKLKDELILDIGMAKHLPGSRIYALAKGLIDGGVKLKIDSKVFPPESRINGEHLKVDKKIISKMMEKLK